MERTDNYRIQSDQAKARFLTYDQARLIQKLRLKSDAQYLYAEMLCKPYRIHRATGDIHRREEGSWMETNAHGEVMTLLDLVCDSREDRFLTGRWKNMQSFGLMFHRNLLEAERDPFAQAVQLHPEAFQAACRELNGLPIPGGDLAYGVELFDGLRIGLVFWAGDEEFAPRVRILWDENAPMYIRYETMHFALRMAKNRILERMKALTA